MRRRPPVPGRPTRPLPTLLAGLLAASAAAGTAWLSGLSAGATVAFVGVSSTAAIGWTRHVMACRSIGVLEGSYLELDRALFASEQRCDRLAAENEGLAAANVELRAAQIASAELLNLANERSNGQMRALVEETGAELAEILLAQLRFAQRTPD